MQLKKNFYKNHSFIQNTLNMNITILGGQVEGGGKFTNLWLLSD